MSETVFPVSKPSFADSLMTCLLNYVPSYYRIITQISNLYSLPPSADEGVQDPQKHSGNFKESSRKYSIFLSNVWKMQNFAKF